MPFFFTKLFYIDVSFLHVFLFYFILTFISPIPSRMALEISRKLSFNIHIWPNLSAHAFIIQKKYIGVNENKNVLGT